MTTLALASPHKAHFSFPRITGIRIYSSRFVSVYNSQQSFSDSENLLHILQVFFALYHKEHIDFSCSVSIHANRGFISLKEVYVNLKNKTLIVLQK